MDLEKPNILFVDDEEQILWAYRKNFARKYNIITASSGEEALEIVSKNDIAVIITDYNMGGIDGVELLSRLRDISPDTVRMLITGYADLKTAMKAVNEGYIFRFLTKPADLELLLHAIEAALQLFRLIRSEKELNMKLMQAYRQIDDDLKAAAKLQQSFLPAKKEWMEHFSYDWIYFPSIYLSGDTFNFFRLNKETMAFYIIDVSGHGISSSIMSINLSRLLNNTNRKDNPLIKKQNGKYEPVSPPEVLTDLNQRYLTESSVQYFTMVYGIINENTGEVRYSCAGHPAPLFEYEGQISGREISSFPIGIFKAVEYEEYKAKLKKGGRVFIYSDGVTECENPEMVRFSEAGLRSVISGTDRISIGRILEKLVSSLNHWRGNEKFEDDITVLVFEYN
ncbi:MAG: PP2C family protein-serine/threonine phosphatase [Candidatus Kapaibacterium sp.]